LTVNIRQKYLKTFSVILSAYNAAAYLPMCLSSITHQSFTDWEVLVVDDGSTDDTPAIADAFAQVDERVHVVHQPNQGQAAARNRAIEQATGEWLVFVDADDYWDTHYLEHIVSALGEDADVLQLVGRYAKMTAPWTRCLRRSWYRDRGISFPEQMRHFEDVIWTVDLWQAQGRVKHYPVAGYYYNDHADSNSHTSSVADRQLLFRTLRQRPFALGLCPSPYRLIALRFRLTLHFLFRR